MTAELIEERVALLRKFRETLLVQREKFRQYLTVLDKEEASIIENDPDTLTNQVELENQIVREILAVQKVVEPMEELYKAHGEKLGHDDQEILELQNSLDHIKEEVLKRNQRNRDLLKGHMNMLRQRIDGIKVAPRRNRVYGGQQVASYINIQG